MKTPLSLGFDLRTRDQKSHALATQPRTHKKQETLAANKQKTDAVKFPMLQIVIIAKVPPNKLTLLITLLFAS